MSRPPRVLLVTPRYPPSLGGIERHVAMLAAGLAGRGLDVAVATTGSEDTAGQERTGNPSIRRFPTLRDDEVFFLSPRLALWLLRSAGRYDLVHVHSYHTPVALVGAIAAWLHRVPFVVTPHYHGTGHTKARALLHRPYRRAGTWMVRRAALVLCNSQAERTLVQADFGSDLTTRVVLPGIDAPPTAYGERPAQAPGTLVLAGGRLERYKQVDVVVQAMAHLPPDFRLLVFGEGPDRDRIAETAVACGVEDRVEVAGRLSDEALQDAFASTRVFVSLSRREAFGLTVLEAAAAGSVVVCSDIPAYREVSGLAPPGSITLLDVDADPSAVANSIRAAAGRPRPDPGIAGLPTWAGTTSGVLDAYVSVLTRDGRALVPPQGAAPAPRRLHIAGGSGSGKTTLARDIGALLAAPVFHLDDIARDPATGRLTSGEERLTRVAEIASLPAWVTEGIHVGWTDALVQEADAVLWLDHTRARSALLRVGRRFLAGGLAESRRLRGVRRFLRPRSYWHHLRALRTAAAEIRAYERRAPDEPVGDAGSRAATAAQLAPHAGKVVHCVRQADVEAFLATIRHGGAVVPALDLE